MAEAARTAVESWIEIRLDGLTAAERQELDQLLDELELTDDGLRERLADAEAEIERLKIEGVPGVMHEIDKAFYDLTVTERDYERTERDHERRKVDALRAQLATAHELLRRRRVQEAG
jgi:hypothetical protein